MTEATANTKTQFGEKFFFETCVEKCWGKCCDPWWGVIFYTLRKPGGISDLSTLRPFLIQGLKERAKRIMDAYVTNETPPRALFGEPERYNLRVEKIEVEDGNVLRMDLCAMFAFSCEFFTGSKDCGIHPTKLGKDIRPPHCAELGELKARQGEKGFCRIIGAAVSGKEVDFLKAIEMEKKVSSERYEEGSTTPEGAADAVLKEIRSLYAEKFPARVAIKKDEAPGRNDPCPCGSGKKFKKCHGA